MTPSEAALKQELLDLKSSTHKLEADFNQALYLLKRRLALWEQKWQTQVPPEPLSPPVVAEPKSDPDPLPPTTVSPPRTKADKPQTIPVVEPAAVITPPGALPAAPKSPPAPQRIRKQWQLPPRVKEVMLYPLQQSFDYLKGIYQHYQQENKLPVFFMTLGGILALLFGFGYLMQLGVSYMLTHISERTFEALKIGGSFLTAAGIIWWGERLVGKGKRYREFGSAMLGLGISLVYLILYFMSDAAFFPAFRSPFVGWGLVLLNSALGLWLGLRHEAKVVAVISLLGGAFAPFYLHTTQISAFYLGYLWLLTLTAVWLSQKINWPALRTGAFLVIAFLMEWIWFQHPERLSPWIFSTGLHAFCWLFVATALWDGLKWRKQLASTQIFLLAGATGLFLVNQFLLFQAHAQLLVLGLIFFANALALGLILATQYRRLSSQLHWVFLLLIGGLAGLAIPAVLNQGWMGLAWAFEGWLLLTLGLKTEKPRVRVEGLLLMGIAFGKMLLSFPSVFSQWSESLWTAGYFNWLSMGLGFLALLAIYQRFPAVNKWEQALKPVSQQILGIWFSVSLLLASVWYLQGWGWIFALLPIGLLIYGGRRFAHIGLEASGLGQLVLLTVPYFLSVRETLTLRLSQQSLEAQIGIVCLGLVAFSLQYWYEGRWHESPFFKIVRGLRELVYVILPLIYLRPVYRNLPEYLPFALLLSVGLAAGLAWWLRPKKQLFSDVVLTFSAHAYLGYLVVLALGGWAQLIDHAHPLQAIEFYWLIAAGAGLIAASMYWKTRSPLAGRVLWELSYLWWVAPLTLLIGVYLAGNPWPFFSIAYLGVSYLADRQKLFMGTILQLLSTVLWLGWVAQEDWALLNYGFWGSVLLSAGIYYWTQKATFRVWTFVLGLIAIALLLGIPEVGAALTGALVLGLVYLAEFKLPSRESRKNMLGVQWLTALYPGLLLFLLLLKLTDGVALTGALGLAALYYAVLTQVRQWIPVIQTHYRLIFRLSQILLGLSLINLYQGDIVLSLAILLPAMTFACTFFLGNQKKRIYPPETSPIAWQADHWLWHLLAIAFYTGVHGHVGRENWGIGLTLLLIIHGLAVLFLSARGKYQHLLRLSIALFVLGFGKLILYDFSQFGLVPKVLVSMGIGALMLLGSRLFLKYRKEEKPEN
jgi:hypothetical protein